MAGQNVDLPVPQVVETAGPSRHFATLGPDRRPFCRCACASDFGRGRRGLALVPQEQAMQRTIVHMIGVPLLPLLLLPSLLSPSSPSPPLTLTHPPTHSIPSHPIPSHPIHHHAHPPHHTPAPPHRTTPPHPHHHHHPLPLPTHTLPLLPPPPPPPSPPQRGGTCRSRFKCPSGVTQCY